jgi:hypothetical protein
MDYDDYVEQQDHGLRAGYRHMNDATLKRVREKYSVSAARSRLLGAPVEESTYRHLRAINAIISARQKGAL